EEKERRRGEGEERRGGGEEERRRSGGGEEERRREGEEEEEEERRRRGEEEEERRGGGGVRRRRRRNEEEEEEFRNSVRQNACVEMLRGGFHREWVGESGWGPKYFKAPGNGGVLSLSRPADLGPPRVKKWREEGGRLLLTWERLQEKGEYDQGKRAPWGSWACQGQYEGFFTVKQGGLEQEGGVLSPAGGGGLWRVTAKRFLNMYMEISTALGDAGGLGKAYKAIAKSLESEGKLSETVQYLEKFAEVSQSNNQYLNLEEACMYLGVIFNSRGQYKKGCWKESREDVFTDATAPAGAGESREDVFTDATAPAGA
ncbi:unnamed protein product, partial [Coregonus sp. 'balchen']